MCLQPIIGAACFFFLLLFHNRNLLQQGTPLSSWMMGIKQCCIIILILLFQWCQLHIFYVGVQHSISACLPVPPSESHCPDHKVANEGGTGQNKHRQRTLGCGLVFIVGQAGHGVVLLIHCPTTARRAGQAGSRICVARLCSGGGRLPRGGGQICASSLVRNQNGFIGHNPQERC